MIEELIACYIAFVFRAWALGLREMTEALGLKSRTINNQN